MQGRDFFERAMGDEDSNSTWTRSHRFGIGLVVYAVAGWVAVRILAAMREYAGLPDNLDSGFIAVFVAGFVAMIILVKTHIAGGGPPIFHALRVVSLVLLFTASGLLVAHWLNPDSTWAHPPSVVAYDTDPDTATDASGATDGCDSPIISE